MKSIKDLNRRDQRSGTPTTRNSNESEGIVTGGVYGHGSRGLVGFRGVVWMQDSQPCGIRNPHTSWKAESPDGLQAVEILGEESWQGDNFPIPPEARGGYPNVWMSYNAAQRAINMGYTQVLWYRGGVEAWQVAGLPTQNPYGN